MQSIALRYLVVIELMKKNVHAILLYCSQAVIKHMNVYESCLCIVAVVVVVVGVVAASAAAICSHAITAASTSIESIEMALYPQRAFQKPFE